MLEQVVHRVRQARQVHQVVVATSTVLADDAIVELCQTCGIDCVRGSEPTSSIASTRRPQPGQ
ncbi:MAG: hypothetical protein HC883_04550, partial [Bdellovibrionaceae bacterium]|nr:hypothetical protein [Pseudobdellovibrionaceae bacterium]